MTDQEHLNEGGENSTDADRHPDIRTALTEIADAAELVDGQPEHLEIHFLASGEATWKMFIKGRDETEGGVLEPAER